MALVACVQMRCGDDVAANLDAVARLTGRAAREGATLVATPENSTFLGSPARKAQIAEPLDGPTHRALGDIAAANRVWLLVGSVAEACEEAGKFHNTSLLFDATGRRVASYRKIHLFDIDLADGTRFTESAHVSPGAEPVVADSPAGCLGLSICYDLRFPELYQRLVTMGAELLTVPSAFTVPTGRAHWHTLLRARAIENQCFVLAPAQEGDHGGGRESFGHSLIVDPWGAVLAECQDGEGLALAELNLHRLREIRRAMPLSTHRRLRP